MWNKSQREREEASNEPNYRFSVLIFPEESCFSFYTEGEKKKENRKEKEVEEIERSKEGGWRKDVKSKKKRKSK